MITARLFADDGRRSESASETYLFCLTDMVLESDTKLDWRPVFNGNGLTDLLGGLGVPPIIWILPGAAVWRASTLPARCLRKPQLRPSVWVV